MIALEWKQVAAWRLTRQYLMKRTAAQDALTVVRDLGALHAQLMSAAELSLWARVDGLPSDFVERALWEERALVKTWAIRGTLHLVSAQDFPLFVAAMRAFEHFRKNSWLKYFGVTLAEIEAIIEGVHATLTDSGMTREALAEALADHTGNPHLKERFLSGWGMLLKPAAFQGNLCFAPNQGHNVTFVRPDLWLGKPVTSNISSDEAFQELLVRYLRAFGPATPEDFARWWGLQPAPAKKMFKAAGDTIERVNVEGWEAYLPADALNKVAALPEPAGVRLLPFFDPYVVAMPRGNRYFLAEENKAKVYRPRGWIAPVVLSEGRVVGVWAQEKRKERSDLTVTIFEKATEAVRDGIEREAATMGAFLRAEMRVTVEGA